MLKLHPEYLPDASDGYFPEGVNFHEPLAPADFKPTSFRSFPETLCMGKKRGIEMVEILNKRI